MIVAKDFKISPEFIATVDAHIRAGEFEKARRALRSLKRAKIGFTFVEPIAALCRRAGLAELAVHVLNPHFSNTQERAKKPSDSLVIEYASSLSQIGAAEEAFLLLQKLDDKNSPRALFAMVTSLVPQWDYEGTIAYLKSFLNIEKKDAYMRLVAEINLAAAYVATERYEEAGRELKVIHNEAARTKSKLIQANALQLSAQCAILNGDWRGGEEALNQSAKLFEKTHDTRIGLFVEKWRTFLLLRRNGYSKNVGRQLEGVRTKARKVGHWETLRECDRYQADAQDNLELATHLYFGTRWPKYRDRIRKRFSLPTHYEWKPEGESEKVFELSTGKYDGRTTHLKLGQLPHAILNALCGDFYRPLRLATFHHLVFPNQSFNPVHSANCLHRALSRFRAWTKTNRLPFGVAYEEGLYRIELKKPVGFLLREGVPRERKDWQLTQLRRRLAAAEFRLTQVTTLLTVSASNARRLMQNAVSIGVIEKIGGGRGSRYRFVRDPDIS